MFAIKTSNTQTSTFELRTSEIQMHTITWGSCLEMARPILMDLYQGMEVVIKIINDDKTTPTLQQLVIDRANDLINVLQKAFASASFELLLSVEVYNNVIADGRLAQTLGQVVHMTENVNEWLNVLFDTVKEELIILDKKYYPLIVSELCNPTLTTKVAKPAKKTTKK